MKNKTWAIIILCSAFSGMVCSCSGNKYLTKETVASQQNKVVSYYNLRAEGLPFRSEFYAGCDSSASTVPDADGAMRYIYQYIATVRGIDSTGVIVSENKSVVVGSAFFEHLAEGFDIYFRTANAGRK